MIAPGREGLHAELVRILGSRNVYYQPPSNISLKYPCIVYSRDGVDIKHADDGSYIRKNRYQLMHISKTPDSPVVDRLLDLPHASFSSYYIVDGLHHDVVSVYH